MNILIINQFALTPRDAGGTRHFSLAKYLVRRGHNVTIYASNSAYLNTNKVASNKNTIFEEIEGVNFVWMKSIQYQEKLIYRMLHMMIFFFQIIFCIDFKPRQYDVVIGSTPYPTTALAALIVCKLYQISFILEIRDLWPEGFIRINGLSKYHPMVLFFAVVEKILYRYSDYIVTLLKGSEKHIQFVSPSSNRISVIPNGFDFDFLKFIPKENLKKTDHFTFLYAGAMGLANNLEPLIKAFGMVSQQLGVSRLHIYGDGSEKNKLILLVEQSKIDNVRFFPPVVKEKIYEIYANADAFVFPLLNTPLYKYGISQNKSFDYLASKKPILMASNMDPSINHVLQSGAAINVNPDDLSDMAQGFVRIFRLSDEKRQQMGEKGYRFLEEHYSVENHAIEYEIIMLELVNQFKKTKRNVVKS
jgi:glycosyltransferase involved in cell wall biosynthesis